MPDLGCSYRHHTLGPLRKVEGQMVSGRCGELEEDHDFEGAAKLSRDYTHHVYRD